MRRVSAALLGACAFIAAGGVSAQMTAAPAVAAAAAHVADRQPAAAAPVPPEPGIGATLSLEGNTRREWLDVAVLKVVDPARTTNQIFAPEPGNRFVAVQFQLKNTGEAPYKDSPVKGAVLVDADGKHFAAALFAKTSAGPVDPGGARTGPMTVLAARRAPHGTECHRGARMRDGA
ncbi:hypothetical protein [Streptomyces sp. NPDC021622]|uniref:DUF4352 domain-containing protein n=1 Tax=Streptomyces sp. NPDC021622 TaxID=3155013 RepID=UPI0033DB7F42